MKRHRIKTKKTSAHILKPLSAFAALIGLGMPGAKAQDIFNATFPASWNGTSTTVTDLGGSGNTGFQSGTATYTTSAVPPGAAAGTGSMALAGAGGIKVTPTGLLNNAAIATAGGFTYNIDFLWNGTASPSTQKLVDYAGTESLQLVSLVANTSATMEMAFASNTGVETNASSTTILPNTWYNVTMTFNTAGNSVVGGALAGIESLYVNGSLISSVAATKGDYGDSLNRPLAIGEFGYGHTTSILGLTGDIYSASVDFGVVVPEPSSTALLGVFGGLGMAWKFRRRKG